MMRLVKDEYNFVGKTYAWRMKRRRINQRDRRVREVGVNE
jgi:hypothetical protein